MNVFRRIYNDMLIEFCFTDKSTGGPSLLFYILSMLTCLGVFLGLVTVDHKGFYMLLSVPVVLVIYILVMLMFLLLGIFWEDTAKFAKKE